MPLVIDELVTLLGLEMKPGVKATVEAFNRGTEKVTKMATKASIALTAAAGSIFYFIENTNKAAGELDKFAELTGIGSDKLQAWQYAAQVAGGSASSLQGDLEGLVKSMSSPIPGEFNHALFMLGVNLKKDNGELKTADEILLDIADKFQNMSKQRQIQWASRIGISDDTLLLLQQGRRAILDLHEQAAAIPTIVDPESLRNAREFTIQLTLMGRTLKYIGQMIASAAGPMLKEIVKDTQSWLKANRELIQSKIVFFIESVTKIFRRLWRVFSENKDVLVPLIAVIAILNSEWIAGVAIIAAVILIIDDLITYFEGGTSATGALIEKSKELWKEFEENYPGISGLLSDFWDILSQISAWAYEDFIDGWNKIEKNIKPVAELIDDIIKGLDLAIETAKQTGEALGIKGSKDFDLKDFIAKKRMKWSPIPSFLNPLSSIDQMKKAFEDIKSFTNRETNVTINQNITGSNAPAIADETARKTSSALTNVYPGGLAPGVQ